MAIEQKITEYVFYFVYFVFLYYSVYWLIVLATYKNTVPKKVTIKEYPAVTIAVPAYNEAKTVSKTIHSLFALDYPKDKLHVICINDGSKDNTGKVITDLKKKYVDRQFTIIHQTNQGKFAALNNALAQTDTPYFGCLDADSEVEPDSLKHLIADFIIDPKLAATMPLMKIRSVNSWLDKIQNIEYMTSLFFKKLHETRDCINVTPGPFSIFNTQVIKKLGGYRKGHMTEDLEMALRLQKNHYTLRQNTSAFVHTNAPKTLKGYYKQRIRWNRGTFLNAWDYQNMVFNPAYGDFGFIQLPMIAISGLMAAIIFTLIIITKIRPLIDNIKTLLIARFDIWPYISSMEFHFNFLSLDTFLIVITITMILVMITYVTNSMKLCGEKWTLSNIWGIIAYFYLYGLLTSAIWFMTFVDIIFSRKEQWHK